MIGGQFQVAALIMAKQSSHLFLREIEEELGVASEFVSSDFQIAYFNLGQVVNGVPRMNLYVKALIPSEKITKTEHVEKWAWLSKDEFLKLEMNPSYDKSELAKVIFG